MEHRLCERTVCDRGAVCERVACVCVKGLCERVVCVCVRDNVCKELCLIV